MYTFPSRLHLKSKKNHISTYLMFSVLYVWYPYFFLLLMTVGVGYVKSHLTAKSFLKGNDKC